MTQLIEKTEANLRLMEAYVNYTEVVDIVVLNGVEYVAVKAVPKNLQPLTRNNFTTTQE